MLEGWKLAPVAVRWAAAGTMIEVVQHGVALCVPPHPTADLFHAVSGPLYAWLALMVLRGRNWVRVTITVLLAVQGVGRVIVFAGGSTWVQAGNVVGWAVSLAIVALLWWPPSSRRHFAPEQTALVR